MKINLKQSEGDMLSIIMVSQQEIVTNASSSLQISPYGETVYCKKCGQRIGFLYTFSDKNRIYRVDPGNLVIVLGSHPATGKGEEQNFVFCHCQWETIKKTLSGFRKNIYLYENSEPEENKGYFLTAKEAMLGDPRDILRWQMSGQEYLEVLEVFKKLC